MSDRKPLYSLQYEPMARIELPPRPETRVQRIQRERLEQTGKKPAKAARKPVFAHELVTAVDQAIAEYGEYTYLDKGANEVIDVKAIALRLEGMNATVIRDVLVEFIQQKGEHLATPLAESLVHGLDERSDFEDIVDHELIGPLY